MENIEVKINAKLEVDSSGVQENIANNIQKQVEQTIQESNQILQNQSNTRYEIPEWQKTQEDKTILNQFRQDQEPNSQEEPEDTEWYRWRNKETGNKQKSFINQDQEPTDQEPNSQEEPEEDLKSERVERLVKGDRGESKRFIEEQKLTEPFEKLTGDLNKRLGEILEDEKVQQGLTETEKMKINQFRSQTEAKMETFTDKTSDSIDEDLEESLSKGYLTRSEQSKYSKKVKKAETTARGKLDEIRESAAGLSGILSDEKMEEIDEALNLLAEDLNNNVVTAIERFHDSVKELKDEFLETIDPKTGKPKMPEPEGGSGAGDGEGGLNLKQVLAALGVTAMLNTALQEGYVKPSIVGAQITARETTAFDLNSPVSQYSASKQSEVFKSTQERSLEASQDAALYGTTIGAVVGGAIAVTLAPATGGLSLLLAGLGGAGAGAVMGNSVLGSVLGTEANVENMAETSAMDAKLKSINQIYGKMESMVNSFMQYEKDVTKLRAFDGAREVDLAGYTHQQQTQMQLNYIQQFGRNDSQNFRDITNYSRMIGADPTQLYSFGKSAQRFDKDENELPVNLLAGVKALAIELYGKDSNAQVVEILSSIRNISEAMLEFDKDVSQKDAMKFANIPALLFGTDSTYGRLNQKGGQVIDEINGLFTPKNDAHDAMLWQILQPKDPLEFQDMKKGGLFYGDNFEKMFTNMPNLLPADNKLYTGLALNGLGVENKVIRDALVEIFTMKDEEQKNVKLGDAKFTGTREDFVKQVTDPESETGKKINEELKKGMKETSDTFSSGARKLISSWESTEESINNIQLGIANSYKKTMQDMQLNMAKLDEQILSSKDTFKSLDDVIDAGFSSMKMMAVKLGFLSPDEADLSYNKVKYSSQYKDFFETHKKEIGSIWHEQQSDNSFLGELALLIAEKTDTYEKKGNMGSEIKDHSGVYTNEVVQILTDLLFVARKGNSYSDVKVVLKQTKSLNNNETIKAEVLR